MSSRCARRALARRGRRRRLRLAITVVNRSSYCPPRFPRRATSGSAEASAERAGPAGPIAPESDRGKPDHDDLGFRLLARRPRSPRGPRPDRRRRSIVRRGGQRSGGIGEREPDAAVARDRRRARELTRPRRRRRAAPPCRGAPSAASTAPTFGPPPSDHVGVLGGAATERLAPRRRDLRRRHTRRRRGPCSPPPRSRPWRRRAATPDERDHARAERVARRDRERRRSSCVETVAPHRRRRRRSRPPRASPASAPACFARCAPATLLRAALSSREQPLDAGPGTSSGFTRSAPAAAQLHLLVVDVLERARAGDGLDPAQVGADRPLAHDLDRADEAERVHVRAAAQLDRVLARLEHPHEVAVLVAEERDRADAARRAPWWSRSGAPARRRSPRRSPAPRSRSSWSRVTAS